MAEIGLSKNEIITQLARSEHGDLAKYLPLGIKATKAYPDFVAHLISWNSIKGQIRDSKIALPVVMLQVPGLDEEFVENAIAHISRFGPREMLKAIRFCDLNRPTGYREGILRVVRGSIAQREKNWPKWERTMLQHRKVLREIMSLVHFAPADERTDACLFRRKGKRKLEYPEGGLFAVVRDLKGMSSQEAAGTILQRGIPFIVAAGAMGDRMKETDVLLALIKGMSASELVTNTKNLEKWGMKQNSALRGAYQEALSKAQGSTKNLLKASTAVEALDDEDEDLKEGLRNLQEKQIKQFGGVDGDWLVLGDCSPSMNRSVEVAKEVAATLTAMVKGKVILTFFHGTPTTYDVTGKSLDEIKKQTRHITAGGSGTSIGCGLQRLLDGNIIVDGIAVVSDGEENTSPRFAAVYRSYAEMAGKQIPVYFYQTIGGIPNFEASMAAAHLDLQVFDLRNTKTDYYSLPNLVQTMRTNRYSLIDEIMEARLLKLPDEWKAHTGATKVS